MTGDQIRAARHTAGLSLRGLAGLAKVDPGYLSQIENGRRTPSPEILRRLSEVLGTELSEPAPLRAALELLTSDTPAAEIADADAEADAVQQLRLLDDQVGGVDSYPVVAATLAKVRDPATYSEVAQVAGWVAGDAGREDIARRHYLAGVQAATASGNRVAGVNNLSSLAYLLAGTGDAVLIARAAVQVPGVPASMAALAAERLAWASARVGNADATFRALDAADEAFDRRTPDSEPAATYWLSVPEMEIMRGRCYVALRRPLRAVPLLERITSSYSWSTRESALYLTYLAEAYQQAGEPEAAGETLQRARDLAAGVHSERLDERLRT